MNQDEEQILARCLRAQSVGFATITYWDIIVTTVAVYFIQVAENAAPGVWGAIAEVSTKSGKKQESEAGLDYFLNKFQSTIRVERNQLSFIDASGRKIIFHTEGKKYKFKPSKKDLDKFRQALQVLAQK